MEHLGNHNELEMQLTSKALLSETNRFLDRQSIL